MHENTNFALTEARGLRESLRALRRRKWTIILTFVVTAAALMAHFVLRNSVQATCFIAVTKPSELFVGERSSAAVSLFEGQSYREMIQSVAFATKVADSLIRDGLDLSPGDVAGSLQVEYRDPDLLRLKAMAEEPDTAVRIVNIACQTLVDLNQTGLRSELGAQVASITQLRRQAATEVEEAQVALTAYMQQNGLVNVDFNSGSSELQLALDVLAQQEMGRAREEAALQAAEEQLRALKVQQGTPTVMSTFPVADPGVTSLRSQLEAVRIQLWEARKEFTDEHPVVKDLAALLTNLQRELDGHVQEMRFRKQFRPTAEHELAIHQKIIEINQQIVTHKAQIAAWSRLIQEQRHTFGVIPSQRGELERLKLSLAFAEERYRTLSRRLDETRISLEAIKGTISIVQPAVGPDPRGQRRRIQMAAMLLLALPLGVGLLVDYMDDTIRSPVAFARKTGTLCLGTVPKSRELRSTRTLLNGSAGRCLEAFHILRSGLRFASGDLSPRRIAIVGTKRGEGRSTLVLHLALALAEEQKRVIIVDADLRTSSLAHKLKIWSRGGLVEVLAGERSLDDVLHRVWWLNIILVPAMASGRVLPPNVELLFRTPQFAEILDELSSRADIILVDTPPILEFADVLELLPYMDGMIFVAEAGHATQDDVQRALDLVRSSGVRELGVVLNKVRNGG